MVAAERGRRARGDGGGGVAVGHRQPDRRGGDRDLEDAPHRVPVGLLEPHLAAERPHLRPRPRVGPHRHRLAGRHPRQPARPALLERDRRPLRLLRGGHGRHRRRVEAERRGGRSGPSSTTTPWSARGGTRNRPTSIRTASSTPPTPSRSWPRPSPTRSRRRRCRRPPSRRRWPATTGSSTRARTPTSVRPNPRYKVQTPPFYAAWSTPILHDSLTGLRTNPRAQVVDIHGDVIPGLYCAGESQGGFAQHGLGRCLRLRPHRGARRCGERRERLTGRATVADEPRPGASDEHRRLGGAVAPSSRPPGSRSRWGVKCAGACPPAGRPRRRPGRDGPRRRPGNPSAREPSAGTRARSTRRRWR